MQHQSVQENSREAQLRHWVNQELARLDNTASADIAVSWSAVSGDASFRRYFRISMPGRDYIAVDAPPEQEDSMTFVKVARLLAKADVWVPTVYAKDFDQGFMLLEDFGDRVLLDSLLEAQRNGDNEQADRLYTAAIDTLVEFQIKADKDVLGPYDRRLLHSEMVLFEEWFCQALLQKQLTAAERNMLEGTLALLEDAALAQPTVLVHRDYHSRNLILLNSDARPGIIDFQDAVSGPYTYDLVSLLRDCYICWSRQQVAGWAAYYLKRAQLQGLHPGISPEQLVRDFDLMGLQRHLKVMGIFSRLYLRDNRSAYLADIPRVAQYILEVSGQYPQLEPFRDWFQHIVLPLANDRLSTETG